MNSRLIIEAPRALGDTLELAARLEFSGVCERLWWRVPRAWENALTDSADPWVIGLLFPMMQRGGGVTVEGRVSPSLLTNLDKYMAIWRGWAPGKYQPVQIEPRIAAELARPGPGMASQTIVPFSCGADSCFTAFRHARRMLGAKSRSLGAAVVMDGFDIRPDQLNAAGMYAEVLASARQMLASLGIPCIAMASNFHDLNTTWTHSFGTQLVSGMALWAGRFEAALIPNNVPYAQKIFPWGSTPITDLHLGSAGFQVIDDGGECSRVEKIALLGQWPEALRHLRVCFTNPGSGANCGRCEKCVRTILGFRAAGVPLPAAFLQDVTDGQIRGIRFVHEISMNFWYELQAAARARGLQNESWVKAIDATLARGRRRMAVAALLRPFVPLRNGVRQIFRGSPLSRRELAAREKVVEREAGAE